ncbi:MAG: prohibitin family protein [Candidatus Aenigmarchaeota archaeon]|nr:prohibitin family protein [Candidatus Aenigmarchaeota archaeon]
MAPPKTPAAGFWVAVLFITLLSLFAVFSHEFIAFGVAVGLLIAIYKHSPDAQPFLRKLIPAVVALALIVESIVIIGAGERGVLLTFGKVEDAVFGEGLHFKIPYVQSVPVFNVKTQKYEALATAASKDLQDVKTTVALNFRISSDMVNKVYQTIGIDYENIVIAPAIQESVKASTAGFNAEELITQRPVIKQKIEESLKERLGERNIIVETVSITDFQFSPEFSKAIEQKQVAQQLALKAERDLDRIKIEAEQLRTQALGEADAKVTRAKAETEALKLQRDIINEQLLRLRAIEKWDGILPKVTGAAVPFIDVSTLGAVNSSG